MDWQKFADSELGKELVKYLEGVKSRVADVRFQPELDNKVRLGVIQVLDEMVISKLKVLRTDEPKDGTDEWN